MTLFLNRKIREPAVLVPILALTIIFAPIAIRSVAKDWRLPRGNAQSSGSSDQSLPSQLAEKWKFKGDEAFETIPVVAGSTVFVADVFGKIYALDRQSGEQRWVKNYDTGFVASPAVDNDKLFIGDIEGNVYAIDTKSGKELWKKNTDGEISGAAGLFGDKVLVACQDGNLYCLKQNDGSQVWVYQADDQIRCSPTIADDRTFLGGCDGQLHIIDLKTGTATEGKLPLGGPTGSTPAVQGDFAYLPIMDGAVFAFDWKNKKQVWSYYDEETQQEYRNNAAVRGDNVIVASQRKQVDCLSAKTGIRKWRYTLRRKADASPVIAGDDVWIAASDGRLIRLALADGKEKWSYEIKGGFVAAPAVTDEELFIADDEGVVRCFVAK